MKDVDNTTTDTSDALSELLTSLQKLLSVSAIMEGALVALEGKRVTLEEKMIKTYLHETIGCLCELVRSTHAELQAGTYDIECAPIGPLNELGTEMESAFRELAKMIDYDLNFLEQYYEHGFYARLINEHRFVERLKELLKS